MKLREAIEKAKEGGHVVYKSWKNASEGTQYFWDKDGDLNWDYVGTVGAKMPEGINDSRVAPSLDMEGFEVFEFLNDRPYTLLSKAVAEEANTLQSLDDYEMFMRGVECVRKHLGV
jgi:hypothetical protein